MSPYQMSEALEVNLSEPFVKRSSDISEGRNPPFATAIQVRGRKIRDKQGGAARIGTGLASQRRRAAHRHKISHRSLKKGRSRERCQELEKKVAPDD